MVRSASPSSSSPPSHDRDNERFIIHRLHTVSLVQLLLVFVVFAITLGILSVILTRQSASESARLRRSETLVDVLTLEQYLTHAHSSEVAHQSTSHSHHSDTLTSVREWVNRFDELLVAVQLDIDAFPASLASDLAEEKRLAVSLEEAQAVFVAALEKSLGAPVRAEGSTLAPSHKSLTELHEEMLATAGSWRQLIDYDIADLSVQSETYSRWRLVVILSQSVLIILIIALTSALYVLPAFAKVLRQVVHHNSQLKQVDSLKTEFLAVASHQLRTPLSEMKWALTLLDRAKDEASRHKFTEQALTSIDTMTQVVASLLNVSRIEQHRIQCDPKVMQLEPVLKASVSALKRKSSAHEVTVSLQLPKEPVTVVADSLLMKQVFQNLINNAIQYNRPKGKVVLTAHKKGRMWLVAVSDTGHGIASKDLKHIFSKFYRGESARKLRPDGSGLGLFFVKKLVERHGGSIWIESQVDKGTTVFVTLPRANPHSS